MFKIIALTIELFLQVLCWIFTGHDFKIVEQRRLKNAIPCENIRRGDWWVIYRCRRCGYEYLYSGAHL